MNETQYKDLPRDGTGTDPNTSLCINSNTVMSHPRD